MYSYGIFDMIDIWVNYVVVNHKSEKFGTRKSLPWISPNLTTFSFCK